MSLGKANFMQHLSPNGKFQATHLHSLDQCATEIITDRKEERRAAEMGPEPMPMTGPTRSEMSDWRKSYDILERREHRLERGGSTMRPGDGLIDY